MILDKKVKVSIITVVYNGADTIGQTIESVINQTYDNIEYIIIDGASIDNTNEIIQKYRKYIDIFISEKDEGLYYAMNKGLLLATGEIIGIINSDDLYVNTSVSKVVEYYNKYHADVIYGNAVWFSATQKSRPYICQNIEELWYRMALPHPTVFIKKEVYKRYGMFNTKYSIAADYDLILKIYSQGLKFGYINENLAYFRRGGMSFQNQDKCIQESKEISLSYIQKCKNKAIWFPKIQEYYIRKKFIQLIESQHEVLLQSIKQILYEKGKNNHLVIFGTGQWGENCFQFLVKTDLHIDFFVDNDSLKWGKELNGRWIKAPNELCGYEGGVIIASFQYAEDIKSQLDILDKRLTSISLPDWAKDSVTIWENIFMPCSRPE